MSTSVRRKSSFAVVLLIWSSKKDIKLIGDYLYKDKNDCYLLRKYNNFKKIIQINTEVDSNITKGLDIL